MSTVNQMLYVEELLANDQAVSLSNWSVISVIGDNAETFLQGQVTCDVSQINQQQASFSALCNHQGRVLATFFLMKKNNQYLCLLPTSIADNFVHHLTKYARFSKVMLERCTQHNLTVYLGEESVKNLRSEYPHLPVTDFQVATNEKFNLIKIPGVVPCYLKVCADSNVSSVDDTFWNLFNILSGYAMINIDTIECFTPHMLNLHEKGAVSFQKGCYVGQEIIARTHYLGKSKRHLCLARIEEADALSASDKIYANGQEAGVIVNVVDQQEHSLFLTVLSDPLDRVFKIDNQTIELIQYPQNVPEM